MTDMDYASVVFGHGPFADVVVTVRGAVLVCAFEFEFDLLDCVAD